MYFHFVYKNLKTPNCENLTNPNKLIDSCNSVFFVEFFFHEIGSNILNFNFKKLTYDLFSRMYRQQLPIFWVS